MRSVVRRDRIHVALDLRRDGLAEILRQHRRVAFDRPQRRAQVVRDAASERFEIPIRHFQASIRRFQLLRALAHAMFERGVELFHLLFLLPSSGDIAQRCEEHRLATA